MTVARAEELIAAQLSVRDGRAAIAFYKSASGATENHKVGGTVRLLLTAEHPQATIDRAVAAGAVEIYAAVQEEER